MTNANRHLSSKILKKFLNLLELYNSNKILTTTLGLTKLKSSFSKENQQPLIRIGKLSIKN